VSQKPYAPKFGQAKTIIDLFRDFLQKSPTNFIPFKVSTVLRTIACNLIKTSGRYNRTKCQTGRDLCVKPGRMVSLEMLFFVAFFKRNKNASEQSKKYTVSQYSFPRENLPMPTTI
jgi:hypothetical protein